MTERRGYRRWRRESHAQNEDMGSGYKCQSWKGSLVHRTETSQTETRAVVKGSKQLPIDALTFTLLQLTSLCTSIHPAPDPACGCRQEGEYGQEGERRVVKTTRPDQTSSSVLERKVNIGHRRGAQRGQHCLLICLHPIEFTTSAIPRIVCPGWTFMTLISLFKIFVSGIKEVCTFVI